MTTKEGTIIYRQAFHGIQQSNDNKYDLKKITMMEEFIKFTLWMLKYQP